MSANTMHINITQSFKSVVYEYHLVHLDNSV